MKLKLSAIAVAALLLVLHRDLVYGENIFNIVDFGATGDGRTKDTAAIVAAAHAASHAASLMSPSVLLFPDDEGRRRTYLTGSFNLSSNMILRVEGNATILGSPDGEDWPIVHTASLWPQFGHSSDCDPGTHGCEFSHSALILAVNISNLRLEGTGTIDGGATADSWWKCARHLDEAPCSGYGRPHLLDVYNGKNVSMVGLTAQNSPDWTLHFSTVDGLHVDQVRVLNPRDGSPNTDGIDLDCVVNAVVENSYFSTGDDA
eukprot:g2113.t1